MLEREGERVEEKVEGRRERDKVTVGDGVGGGREGMLCVP